LIIEDFFNFGRKFHSRQGKAARPKLASLCICAGPARAHLTF
jgi:hypothetical protein